MLAWTLMFLAVALIAGILGFGGISSSAAGIARVVLFAVSFFNQQSAFN